MKQLHLTLYINTEEAETIITFLDEIRALLTTHYAEEIRQHHRSWLDIREDF